MPFKSEKQRRFLWAEHPEIAKRWAREYPESNKGLPMRVEKSDSKEKAAALAVLGGALAKHAVTLTTAKLTSVSVINDDGTIKKSNDGLVRVELPKTEGPTYAGQEQEAGGETSCQKALAPNSEKALDLNNPVAAKLATVLSQALREQLENSNAQAEGRDPLPVPRNMGIKRYAVAPQLHQLPMGMQPQAPAQGQAPPSNGPVGGGNNPTANPIQAFGPLSASGQLNGNAAFGVKNSPDSSKSANIRESVGNFLNNKNEDSAVDPKWGLLGGQLVTAPAALANMAYGKMIVPSIFKTHDLEGYKKMLDAAKAEGVGSRSFLRPIQDVREMAREVTNPVAKWFMNNQRRGLHKAPGAYDFNSQTILTNPKYRSPAVVAHELGHHQGGKALGLAGLLGRNIMGLGTAGALWSGDENTSKNFALGGTAAAAPMMASELDASWRGMRAMQRAGLKGGWRAFGGVPTYAAVAATPMLAHYGKKYFGGFDPAQKQSADSGAWTRAEGKNPEGGLNAKGRASLKAQGHDIKAPVTESNPSGERAQRQNSFCSRMCGMKKHETGAKTKSDPDSRINKSLRKWNCKCSSAYEFGKAASQAASRVSPDLLSGLRQLSQGMRNAGRESAQLARMNFPTLAPKTTELLKGTQAAPQGFGTLSALAPLLRRLAPAR